MTYREEEIKELVRHVLLKQLRLKESGSRKAITAEDINALEVGSTLALEPGTLITPMARETAMARHITLQETAAATSAVSGEARKTVAIGADHGGFETKEMLKPYLKELGFDPLDVGTHSKDAVDYPDIAYAVAEQVAKGSAFRGIVIDAAGIGSCMAANKVPGVRAAMCYDEATAVNSRKHNDANVLSLGSGLLGPTLIKQIVKTWLSGEFEGGRHQKRIDKIIAIERRFAKS